MKKVVIVSPVHNRREITLQCLRSLSRIDRDGLNVHTIIVDDGSTDGTAEAIKRDFPEVELIEGDGSLWYTEGTNIGFRAALKHAPDYILAINDDSIFEEQFLQHLVETAEKTQPSIVGAVLLLWDTPHKVFQTSPVWDTLSGGMIHLNKQTVWTLPERPWNVRQIVGNCVLYPAEAIRQGGLMDSKRFKMLGDAEYTPRLKRMGWNLLIDPRARVFCKPNDAAKGFRSMSLSAKVRETFFNPSGPYDVRRRLHMVLENAPSTIHGIAAFIIFYFRAAIGKNAEGQWGQKRNERPLAEIHSFQNSQ